jgi:uncharacterized protein YndB with AHSA1/START domain
MVMVPDAGIQWAWAKPLFGPSGRRLPGDRGGSDDPVRGRRHGVFRPAVPGGIRVAHRHLVALDVVVTDQEEAPRIVSATREIAAEPERIFELIADPAQQPRWDGNDNLAEAIDSKRVRAVGDVFTMKLTVGSVRENHVVDFEEGRRIAWRPAEPGNKPVGHQWAWYLEPIDSSQTRVTHTYDWTELSDEKRLPRARATTEDKLRASLDRLAALAEGR